MDMTISFCEDWVVTLLYEKSMNLYLYIPPHSAHPPGVLTVIVSGNIRRFHSICSNQEDINRRIKYFYARLLIRGYQRDFLIPVFTEVITVARAPIKRGFVWRCTSYQDKDIKGCVLFHLTYNPRDPTSKYLQRQWLQHLQHLPWKPPFWRLKNKHNIPIGVNSMCVAYIHPINLGNIFTYRKVNCLGGPPVSSYMV